MKDHIRILRLRNQKLLGKTENLIKNPFNQLYLYDEELSSRQLISVLSAIDFCVFLLECSEERFLDILRVTKRLKVKYLHVTLAKGSRLISSKDIYNCFTKVVTVTHTLCYIPDTLIESTYIPYFPTLRRLDLRSAAINSNLQLLVQYSRTLHTLTLDHCDISDVTMLGSIPYLDLRHCNQLVDISVLNDNDHIVIFCCERIHDFSHSFTNSRKIEIVMLEKAVPFRYNLTNWKKVELLRLIVGYPTNTSLIFEDNKRGLPKTVKKCLLDRIYVSAIDFTVTADHALTELKLSNDNTIASLVGLGLDRIAILEFDSMKALTSLQGLGKGRNRKVVLTFCYNIIDYSPLNQLAKVEVQYCGNFKDPSQLNCVRDLTILSCEDINFLSKNSYENISYLTISADHITSGFDGIERISQLRLDLNGFSLIKAFLEQGKEFYNERIELCDYYPYTSRNPSPPQSFVDLHHRYLKDRYDYCNRLPKRWIWFRKK